MIASCQKNPSLIRIWNGQTDTCHCVMEGPNDPKIILFSVDSEYLLTVGKEYQSMLQ